MPELARTEASEGTGAMEVQTKSTRRRRRILTDKQMKARLHLRQLKAAIHVNAAIAADPESEAAEESRSLAEWRTPWPGYRPLPAALVWPNFEIILAIVYLNGVVQASAAICTSVVIEPAISAFA